VNVTRHSRRSRQETDHPRDQEPTGPSPMFGHVAGSSSQGELFSCESRSAPFMLMINASESTRPD
jgi:hypothetical protein